MRFRVLAGAGLAVLLLASGCAQQRSCTIIPMQLRLAQHELESYEKQVATKQADVERETNGLSMAATRLQQLEDEEKQLQALIEAGKAGATGKEERP